jgi:hypothetical protein
VKELKQVKSFVTCAICGKQMRVVSWTHLMTHSITRKEYMEDFCLGPYKLVSDPVRWSKKRRNDYRPYSEIELHQAVKEVFAKCGDVSFLFFRRHYPQIAMQFIQVYGSWDNALKQIGRRAKNFSRKRSWTPEKVLREIKALYKRKGTLSI